MQPIEVDRTRLNELCQAYHVKSLAMFGSQMRGDSHPESDLDLLVEFEPDNVPGFRFFQLERELSALFHLPVELNTPGFLSSYFRDEAVRSAKLVYAG